MKVSRLLIQSILLVVFGFLTLPGLIGLALLVPGWSPLLFADMAIRAVPLCVAVVFNQLFLDGGELTPKLIPFWVVLTGFMLWPFLFLGIRPTLWCAPSWRYGIITYSSCAVLLTIGAACWVFTHLGYFF
jgi:hypothetical protein